MYKNFFKRLLDILISGIALLFIGWFILLVALFLHFANKGAGAFFTQERPGKNGKIFKVIKFKTMTDERDENGKLLPDAERLTKVGKFLRAHHLDELPQLWNVFRGDMAFVGYRPERKYYIDQIMEHDPRYSFLYQIRPGVTSYATLHYGYTDTMEKMLRRLELDLYYLKNRSWWFDCKVLFLTFTGIIFGKKF